jgi:uncharacterized damage-inducible protein DinB
MAGRSEGGPLTTARDFRRIYAYNHEVLERFCRTLERLPWSVVSKDRGATWHSMAGVFHHVLQVHNGWLNVTIQGRSADPALVRRDWDSFGSMREIRACMEEVWVGEDRLLAGLTDASLRRRVKAAWQPKACSVCDALIQVTLEQAHHLGEIIAMLWQEDVRPPEMTWLATNWALEARRGKRGGKAKARRPRTSRPRPRQS